MVEEGLLRPDGGESTTAATGTADAALVQITIALYRALAREVSDAMAIRARDLSEAPIDRAGERLELATQLRLELDRTPEPASLRAYWDEMDALGQGVLWPFGSLTRSDQGLREIVAVVTAAQAYQVCSGAVTYSQRSLSTASQERTSESRFVIEPGDAIARLAAPVVGGLLGFGVAGAVGAGLGVLGGLGVSAVSRSVRKREQTDDYTFLIDRSVQTLERDLPLVIERVREAGLAPVFMIDELDKLKPGSGETTVAGTMRGLMGRIKHLATDVGFFCFLTGRDFFDEVQREIDRKAFPEEHTYFSERLYVAFDAFEFETFLRESIDISPGDEVALTIYVKSVIHGSRLNTLEFRRRVSADWLPRDISSQKLYKRAGNDILGDDAALVSAAIQISIECVLRNPRFSRRLEDHATLRQIATDTAYRMSGAWRHGYETVDLSLAALAAELHHRMVGEEPLLQEAEGAVVKLIGKPHFDYLCELAGAIHDQLSSFALAAGVLSQTPADILAAEAMSAVTDRHIDGLLERQETPELAKILLSPDGLEPVSKRTGNGDLTHVFSAPMLTTPTVAPLRCSQTHAISPFRVRFETGF